MGLTVPNLLLIGSEYIFAEMLRETDDNGGKEENLCGTSDNNH